MELHQTYDSLHHEESVVNDGDEDEEDDPMYQELLDTNDLVTAQLVSAGPAGLAAAAAIASGKKRRNHSFEMNPCTRKRQQTRLMRKLYSLMEEYIVRVGQQAVIICCSPGKDAQSPSSFRVFGSQPLECVIKNRKWNILHNLEKSLTSQKNQHIPENIGQFELPPLSVDGTLIGLERMTQAQLRYFVPEMLKHSTGKSKPGWGKQEWRPVWWPKDGSWANIRSDTRTEEVKRMVPWTLALRKIVRNCYEYHNREDLLLDPIFKPEQQHIPATGGCLVQQITNPDGSVKLVQLKTESFPEGIVEGDGDGDGDGGDLHIVQAIDIKKELSQEVQSSPEPQKKVLRLSRSAYESLLCQLADTTSALLSSSSSSSSSTQPPATLSSLSRPPPLRPSSLSRLPPSSFPRPLRSSSSYRQSLSLLPPLPFLRSFPGPALLSSLSSSLSSRQPPQGASSPSSSSSSSSLLLRPSPSSPSSSLNSLQRISIQHNSRNSHNSGSSNSIDNSNGVLSCSPLETSAMDSSMSFKIENEGYVHDNERNQF
ncbi:hypothetical protein HELRODRAFT_105915 [Helobdella robusta]|uniref:Nuclear respiratory factor 1 NLS/DNA-binding dimerisation domain-containing protein n=1 Tax=Helobdella robusta TaxID=6412 RepID=T1EDY7_HELRO|nr:hypothetical protein HELRODRAFT_105915 [Helobdella robusta]ESO05913.1 hypothetical protein HELRODRAFT_105915 [Helobdella robusta]